MNPIDYSMWEILQKNASCITDLDERKQQLRTERAKLYHIVIAAAIRQWVQISDASFVRLFAVFCTLCNQMRLNLANLEVTDKVR